MDVLEFALDAKCSEEDACNFVGDSGEVGDDISISDSHSVLERSVVDGSDVGAMIVIDRSRGEALGGDSTMSAGDGGLTDNFAFSRPGISPELKDGAELNDLGSAFSCCLIVDVSPAEDFPLVVISADADGVV